jgi:hypothetical protein
MRVLSQEKLWPAKPSNQLKKSNTSKCEESEVYIYINKNEETKVP